jgi:outer membrane receptor protein involved in Fe transport
MRVDLLVPLSEVRKADSYFDANLHVGHNFSERLSFFLRGNNLANQNYEKWLDYPVQPIQVMVGGHKFDFSGFNLCGNYSRLVCSRFG